MGRSTVLTAGAVDVADRFEAPLLHRALRPPVAQVLHRWFGLAIDGVEHLPSRGPFIIAANHHNYLDGVVLSVAVPAPISFLVMPRVWRATPLHPLFHRHLGSIPINLERPDVGALRRALEALATGRVVGIFPEGPFSTHGRLESGLPGVALLALRSGVPVVPAGIQGTYEALTERRFYIPRRHPMRVRFGPPRCFTNGAAGTVREARQSATARIMADIAALLS
ncbi:MAG: 1-acyl-sn-glycerol-3-phosphate acyltransferase [Candidatus Rokuibacteriota bacterium]|nr:MAG: 1-acyl-sn-glycerol-3-phosphate acyltransferase [Candidatus Rokubacteria bacterium]